MTIHKIYPRFPQYIIYGYNWVHVISNSLKCVGIGNRVSTVPHSGHTIKFSFLISEHFSLVVQ